MNPNDYDEDGNNIVPCPICLNIYCPSNDGGKCPDEEQFAKDMETDIHKISEQCEEECPDYHTICKETSCTCYCHNRNNIENEPQ